jgi:dTDP-4-amino-4,6-dideoxygalactose transaminase
VVWLPDFFCNASLVPLRQSGARLMFYPVSTEMEPDAAACQRLALEQAPDIFVLVHFFGQPVVVPWLAPFCAERDTWLIEDATHVLQPTSGVGDVGDAVFYSPHKHLPVPDGSVLVVRGSGSARLAADGAAMAVLRKVQSALMARPGVSGKPAVLWFIKRALQRLGMRGRPRQMVFRARSEPNASSIQHPRMSGLARRLLGGQLPHLPAVAAARHSNQTAWRQVLRWAQPSKAEPVPIIGSNATPYLAWHGGDSEAETEILFERLQRGGAPVSTWPDLPPEVLSDPVNHAAAIALRHRGCFLPIHQCLSIADLEECGRALLVTATAQWQVRSLSREEWDVHWANCSMTNMLQAWEYGAAKEQAEGWKPWRLLVSDQQGKPIGLVQVLTRGLGSLAGAARLNRGPLLVGGYAPHCETSLKLAVLWVFLREARRRRWLLLQAAPELSAGDEARSGMQALGFRELDIPASASGRLSLQTDVQALLMKLNGKWRNSMRKGEKLGVQVHLETATGKGLEILIQRYSELQQDRRFSGLTEPLIRSLAAQPRSGLWHFNLFFAFASERSSGEDPVGVLVSVRAGDTSTYLIGVANDQGRQLQANSVMLWAAILRAKEDGCAWFDIGGLNETTPKGVAEFKRGLNADPYDLVGDWRSFYGAFL